MSQSHDRHALPLDRFGQQGDDGFDWHPETFSDGPISAVCSDHRQASIDAELDLIDDLLIAARNARVRRDPVSEGEALGELTERYGFADDEIPEPTIISLPPSWGLP